MGVLLGVTVRLSLWWMTDLEEGLGLRLVVPLALPDPLVLLVGARRGGGWRLMSVLDFNMASFSYRIS
jgi:hypothetical protein